jgi:hypothetical protein
MGGSDDGGIIIVGSTKVILLATFTMLSLVIPIASLHNNLKTTTALELLIGFWHGGGGGRTAWAPGVSV